MYEVLDNAIDEAQAGFASNVDIILHADGSVSITDNGRGVGDTLWLLSVWLYVFSEVLLIPSCGTWRKVLSGSFLIFCVILQIPTDIHPVTGKSALETVLTVWVYNICLF